MSLIEKINILAKQIDLAVKPIAAIVNDIVFFKINFFGAEFPIVVLWLVIAGILLTYHFKFINITGFKHAIRIVRGDLDVPLAEGEVTHFQALVTALSGTVGIGNIGGVAIAVAKGGPGAIFWMILAGFIGMSTKFVECTLAVKFRKVNADGSISGGPMYYLQQGLASKGWPNLGKYLGIFYAAGIVLACMGIGNMFQSNQAYEQVVTITGGKSSWLIGKGWLFGSILALLIGSVIIGGLKRIVKVTEKIVPFMAVLYVLIGIIIILMNYTVVGEALTAIVTQAFTSDGIKGGAIGALIVGFQRAVFSNEAGIGSAAIAHSAVKTNRPVTEGLVASLGPFIDTIIICTVTGLVIVTSQLIEPSFGGAKAGIAWTSYAFARNISWFPYVLGFAAFLFAFSTAISWSYYGLKGFTYLFGNAKKTNFTFKIIFCIFIVFGSMINVTSIIDISDALVYVVCIPNVIGLFWLAPYVQQELKTFLADDLKYKK